MKENSSDCLRLERIPKPSEQGHQREPTLEYLVDRDVNIVVGHPQAEPTKIISDAEYTVADLARFRIGGVRADLLPKGATVIGIPLSAGFKITALYQHRTIDEIIRVRGFKTRGMTGGKLTKRKRIGPRQIDRMIRAMSRAVGRSLPTVSRIAREKRDPFKILISTILSLRTKDDVTLAASNRLFAIAGTAEEMSATAVRTIEKAIYPVGFYKTKARSIKRIAAEIRSKYNGTVPDSIEELLEFKGVGRKTANLVITLGYGKDGICVDTHVHRVSNRLGLVATKTPEQTEFALMDVLPKKFWIGYNELLVSFGQKVCRPISPLCSTCPLERDCPKIGVGKHR